MLHYGRISMDFRPRIEKYVRCSVEMKPNTFLYMKINEIEILHIYIVIS